VLERNNVSTAITSHVAEKDCEVIDRIKRSERRDSKPFSRKKERQIFACLFLTGMLMTGFSVEVFAELRVRLYQYSKQEQSIPCEQFPEYEIVYVTEMPENITIEHGDWQTVTESVRGTILTMDWTIGQNVRMESDYIYLDAGDTVDFLGSVTPSGKTITVGIQKSNYHAYQTNVSGMFGVPFSVTTPGFYKAYAENHNNVSITLQGCLVLHND
ncbi:MAG: hypothetical protein IKN57_08830, partial [Parasporobacterium sp.]|nr:hypothetical protein [Parasporobacterium sp.]